MRRAALMRPPKEANLRSMNPNRFALTFCLLGLGLSACAGLPDAGGGSGAGSQSSIAGNADARPVSTYGLLLAGQVASDAGDSAGAADYFKRASQQDPEAAFLRGRAFTSALLAGDVPAAAQLAPGPEEGTLAEQQLGRLTIAANAMAEMRPHDALTALTGEFAAPNRAADLLMQPWAAAAAGDWKSALTLPDAKGDRLIDELSRLNQAMLYERAKHYDLAEAAYKQLLSEGDAEGLVTGSYVDFLERRGRRADAVAVCDTALKDDPEARSLQSLRDQAASKAAAPPMPSLDQGAAQALLAPAAIFLAEKQPQLGLAYLRLILRLDPARDEAWMLVGDTKGAMGDVDGARLAFLQVQAGSPDYVDARGRLISTYDQPGDAAKVLDLAQETVKLAPNDDEALALLASALSGAERYDESAKVMDTLMAHLGAQAGWEAYYMRGVALDQSGHWPEAERDFRKALDLKPDASDVLNYLGYSWIDRGERLQEAKAMIEKALSAKPDSGAMVDSLGWAYYRLGDFNQAVEQLERACELEPADPDINDHLGDAYWRAGRRIEARFQWERVLSLEPSAKLRAAVELKLKDGLGDDGRPVSPAPAVASR